MQEPTQDTSREREPLLRDWLLRQLADRGRRVDVQVFDCLDSTNSWCLQALKRGRAVPLVCLAEQQTQGRGRHGRRWQSIRGGSLVLSLAVRVPLPAGAAGALSPAVGLAIYDLLRSLGVADLQLKWPNDILVDGRKLAGVLLETVYRSNAIHAVIGIGVNLDLGHEMPEIEQPWTDLAHCRGMPPIGRNALALRLIEACLDILDRLARQPERVMAEYSGGMRSYASSVRVLQDDGLLFEGEVLGVNACGQLRLRVQGEERLVSNAELGRALIRVRGPGHAA